MPRITQPLWDTEFLLPGAKEVTFFTAGIGQKNTALREKTEIDTNLTIAGHLAAPQSYIAETIRLDILADDAWRYKKFLGKWAAFSVWVRKRTFLRTPAGLVFARKSFELVPFWKFDHNDDLEAKLSLPVAQTEMGSEPIPMRVTLFGELTFE